MAANHEPEQPNPRRAQGLLVTLLMIPVGVLVFVASKSITREFGALGGLLAGGIAGGLFYFISRGLRRAKQMRAPSAADVLATDDRPPVLYLRPFSNDGVVLSGHYFLFKTYEEHLVKALSDIGPVVAVGSPGENARTPEVGAARMYLRDDAWQERVGHLIRQSSLIVLHGGSSPGVLWELRSVLAQGRPERLIVCLPVDAAQTPKKLRHAEARYVDFVRSSWGIFPRPLPLFAGGCAFLYFLPDWTPQLLRRDMPVPAGYPPQTAALRGLGSSFRSRLATA
ncbi:hypothetical protein Acsp06_33680 [Actinomycetospora sp. NBRC 106375]|uniref:hypothetical protein n=1 Tax=Actinomycetospora sp. NBRC 106375 TaxID=3032207 RepID=UPI0024A0D3C1|nr:hypothetical protein [Actinomycetospora sp. NBRC 106375]GLZ47183.1 hypothetical protein Acsp06_33680 [Actinomycetospora sp. NBRC 106375]